MLRRLIGEDVLMTTTLSASPVPIEGDVGQIEQVIMNLALNARDAMPGGGRLTLQTEVQELIPSITDPAAETPPTPVRYAVLSVQDTGVGIDDEAQSRLFEPFYTTKELGKGTGLGLSVTYGIVKSHGGHLRVESRPGQGSLFQVFLPLAAKLPECVDALPKLPEPPRGAATILLVEDNADVRELMRGALTDLGYIVLDAPGSYEAIRIADSHPEPIDLLVTDVVMPALSGVDLAKRLVEGRPEMRVLYVSGYTDHQNAAEMLEGPKVAYLQKPFAPTDLAFTIAQLISRARQKGADQ
jgi:CheY-like chemotaxis protein